MLKIRQNHYMHISKTSYMAGLQCLKLLWNRIHKPELLVVDDALQQVFIKGQEVGLSGNRLRLSGNRLRAYGIRIDTKLSMPDRIKATHAALAQRKPVYEAAIGSGNMYAQIDILIPVRGGWAIVEVKSSTQIHDHYYQDVAFQKYVCDKSGLPIRLCHIITINGNYVKHGPIMLNKLFNLTLISKEVAEIIREVPKSVAEMIKVLGARCPKIDIGPHCSSPNPCPLQYLCWAFLPKHNVFELHRIGVKAYEFMEQGILRIRDIPAGTALSRYQNIQVKCVKTGQPYVNPKAIAEFLDDLEYPISFLDFESFNTPILIYDGTKPYQQIPFQYSLHVLPNLHGKAAHYEFLAEGRDDPRPALLASLKQHIGNAGTILAFNIAFEKGVLDQMAQSFPQHRPWINRILPRIKDLIVPFRRAAYYHPDQHGSNSLKQVMP
ncbi:MAG: DUF2779 domain-containing protein, partial [Candidatus Omnitrophota bacterium]